MEARRQKKKKRDRGKVKKMKDGGKWRVQKRAEKRRSEDALGLTGGERGERERERRDG